MLKFWIWNWAWNEETRRVLLRDCEIQRNIWQPSFQAQFHIQNFNIDISGFYCDRFPRPHWEVIAAGSREQGMWTLTLGGPTPWSPTTGAMCAARPRHGGRPLGQGPEAQEEKNPHLRREIWEMKCKPRVCCICSLQFIIFAPAPMSINMD